MCLDARLHQRHRHGYPKGKQTLSRQQFYAPSVMTLEKRPAETSHHRPRLVLSSSSASLAKLAMNSFVPISGSRKLVFTSKFCVQFYSQRTAYNLAVAASCSSVKINVLLVEPEKEWTCGLQAIIMVLHRDKPRRLERSPTGSKRFIHLPFRPLLATMLGPAAIAGEYLLVGDML